MNPSTDTTAPTRFWTRGWDALVDANPVLAKELLITVRTPIFVGSIAFAPLLLGALVLFTRFQTSYFDHDAGRELFPVYFVGLSIALGIVGASLGSTVVVQEREAGALEALKFSALGPRAIVHGKLAAVVLAEAAIVVCTLPLLAFVLAAGGVSVGETAVALAIAASCGVMAASIGIAVSAHAVNTRRSLLLSLLAAGAMGIAVVIWLALGSDLGPWYGPLGTARAYFEAPFNAKYVALLVVTPAYVLPTVLWLGQAAATSGLMDLSEDRSLPLKRWTVGALAMGTFALVACASMAGESVRRSLAGGWMIATALLATVLLFVFAGEPVHPTRRMRVRPRSLLVRVLYPACLAPSMLFTLFASAAALLSTPALANARSPSLAVGAFWSVAYLSTLGGFMGCVAARRGGARARLLGAGGLVLLMFLFVLFRDRWRTPLWVDAICPLWLDPRGSAAAQSAIAFSLTAWGTAALGALLLLAVRVRPHAASERPSEG